MGSSTWQECGSDEGGARGWGRIVEAGQGGATAVLNGQRSTVYLL